MKRLERFLTVRLALAVTKYLAVLLANYDSMIAGPEMTLLIYLYLSLQRQRSNSHIRIDEPRDRGAFSNIAERIDAVKVEFFSFKINIQHIQLPVL